MTAAAASALWQRITETPRWLPGGLGASAFGELLHKAREGGVSGQRLDILGDQNVSDLLTGMFEGSPFLTQRAMRDVPAFLLMLSEPPEETFLAALATLKSDIANAPDSAVLKSVMRRFKNSVSLLCALCDLAGVWPVMTVTRVLSEAADAAVSQAVRWLFIRACRAGEWIGEASDDPASVSGYFVLAMGKLGAFELNYSSDIDLIVFFDRNRARYAGKADLQTFYVHLTRDLVALLQERTLDGYVFRTDLRLRPDAGATQIALSTVAAYGYYETVGQNWERAAFIKARVCAGDFESGHQFLNELSTFIWRKYLDYAAIADVHAMKRQIQTHRRLDGIAVSGQNIKLGSGGIREIEFFVQTQQLIAGGRQPDLRGPQTLQVLAALGARGWVSSEVVDELNYAYKFLRRLEHRLQMVADEQTHEMPRDNAGVRRIARFSGYEDVAKFERDLTRVLEAVQHHYASLFESAPSPLHQGRDMVFAGATDDPGTLAELDRLGFSQPAQVLAIVRGWHHGHASTMRSERARERLTEVQPDLIAALADTVDPDAAIAGFDRFLSELPAGIQLFALLKAHPALMRLLANIMGSAPRLASILSRRTRLLDAVLDPQISVASIDAVELNRQIAESFAEVHRTRPGDTTQEILDRARVIGQEQNFLVGVSVLTGAVTTENLGRAYAAIADSMVGALLAEVSQTLEHDHGRVPSGEAVVIAFGKLGSREMTAASDLDLMVVYDFEDGAVQSDGRRPLAPSHYYTRLTQRLINALSAPTSEGALYDVDMRLRPSGQKGPLATKLSSFVAYQEGEAWTWEHMALTRARVIAGPERLQAKTEKAIRDVLVRRRQRSQIAQDVSDMRARIVMEKGTSDIWNLKQVRGGLVDLEFIAQHLQLVSAADFPVVLDTSTLASLRKLGQAGVIPMEQAIGLCQAGQLLHDLGQIVGLCSSQPFDPATAPNGMKALLVAAGQARDFEALEQALKAQLLIISRAFDTLVG